MTRKSLTRTALILSIVAVALVARWRAAVLLPIDYDEDDYLRAAQLYAAAIQHGDWRALSEVTWNYEHPPLAKIAFGVAIAALPPAPEIPPQGPLAPAATSLPELHLARARGLSVIFGTLTVWLLALLNPLAGLFLALHTSTIKFTSLVMLEALPALTSAVAVLAYERSQIYIGRRVDGWLALSAVALGLTVASKYVYGIAGIAILLHWLYASRMGARPSSRPMAIWLLLAAAAFSLANPYLWPDPLARLAGSVRYHVGFSRSFLVEVMNLPFFQPLLWLFMWVPWQPMVFPVGLDPLIALCAVLGLRVLWQTRPLYVFWLAAALLFLSIWPTKWPQYIMTLTFPWALAAAKGAETVVWPWVRRRWL